MYGAADPEIRRDEGPVNPDFAPGLASET